MTKLSIIVPVYNTSKYLEKCLDSLTNQSLKDIEIIVINDGSTDNSKDIINKYLGKIVFIDKKNEGIGKTRNLGIKKAKGKYVMFIDSDDYITPFCAERMYERAVQDNLDIVISNYYTDNNGLITEVNFPPFSSASILEDASILNKVNLGPCNKIYKRDLLIKNSIYFEEELKYEDLPFVVKALLNAKRIGKINECLSYYVIHNNSETTTRDKKIFDIIKVVDIAKNELIKYPKIHKEMVNLIVMVLTDYTIQQRYIKNKKERNKFINKAFNYLKNIDSKWRRCNYLKSFNLLRRIIKSNKLLTKMYCNLYSFIKRTL